MPDEEKVQRKRLVNLTLFFRVRLCAFANFTTANFELS